MSTTRMAWSRDLPTREGYYWTRIITPEGTPCMLAIFKIYLKQSGRLVFEECGIEQVSGLDYEIASGYRREWAGPIPEPGE